MHAPPENSLMPRTLVRNGNAGLPFSYLTSDPEPVLTLQARNHWRRQTFIARSYHSNHRQALPDTANSRAFVLAEQRLPATSVVADTLLDWLAGISEPRLSVTFGTSIRGHSKTRLLDVTCCLPILLAERISGVHGPILIQMQQVLSQCKL